LIFMTPPVFSPDSKRVLLLTMKGYKWLVLVDGRPGPEYDRILSGGPTFLPDGSIGYVAMRSDSLFRVKQLLGTQAVSGH